MLPITFTSSGSIVSFVAVRRILSTAESTSLRLRCSPPKANSPLISSIACTILWVPVSIASPALSSELPRARFKYSASSAVSSAFIPPNRSIIAAREEVSVQA